MLDFEEQDVENLYVFFSHILSILQTKFKCHYLYKDLNNYIDDLFWVISIFQNDFRPLVDFDSQTLVDICIDRYYDSLCFYQRIIDEVILYGL